MVAQDDITGIVEKFVQEYKKRAGTDNYGSIRDLLTQIMHYCEVNNLDWHEILDSAEEVFETEILDN